MRGHRQRIGHAEAFIRRRGPAAVFLGRFIAFFRALMPALAGISRMPYPTFLLFNALGGLVWGVGFTLLGYFAGTAYKQVEKTAGTAVAIVVAVVVVVAAVVWGVRRHRAEARGRGGGDGDGGEADGGEADGGEAGTLDTASRDPDGKDLDGRDPDGQDPDGPQDRTVRTRTAQAAGAAWAELTATTATECARVFVGRMCVLFPPFRCGDNVPRRQQSGP